ncbi:winged helix-turn-helix domain-containing protein [Streptomyces sp. MI02-7b]|nr:winged helix-turn-helix domain-containing protein [Streptomyces sp. MI02-7b]MDX3074058.1 winged helix-turn-helix domain-containing protein [Streptomyces sp. MI02-7b]
MIVHSWTLSPDRVLIESRTGVALSVRGAWELLRRHDWSSQQRSAGSGG